MTFLPHAPPPGNYGKMPETSSNLIPYRLGLSYNGVQALCTDDSSGTACASTEGKGHHHSPLAPRLKPAATGFPEVKACLNYEIGWVRKGPVSAAGAGGELQVRPMPFRNPDPSREGTNPSPMNDSLNQWFPDGHETVSQRTNRPS